MTAVHLHVHGDGSLLDSGIKPKNLINRCVELEMPAVAITDHGSLCNVFKIWNLGRENNIKVIPGNEAYLLHNVSSLKEKGARSHITLLAISDIGWKNLMRLHTISRRDYFYQKPCIDLNILKKHSEGIVCLSGCMAGFLHRFARANQMDKAVEYINNMKSIFGDRFYIELMRINYKENDEAIDRLINLGEHTKTKVVGTNDVHYLKKEHHDIHDVYCCIGMGMQWKDPNKLTYSDALYLKSSKEMEETFSDIPEAIESTLEISERCNVDLGFKGFHYPTFPIPEDFIKDFGIKNPDNLDSQGKYFVKKIRDGFKERFPRERWGEKQLTERIKFEIETIVSMGFPSYFLVVQDFLRWCREKGIPIGPGRGSSAGSLVCYCLGITHIDPIDAGLLFERFLNPGRTGSPPDIDTDIAKDFRDEVIDFVIDKYGEDNACKICTYGTFRPKSLIKEFSKKIGIESFVYNDMADAVPETPGVTLKSAINDSPKLKDYYEKSKDDPKLSLLFRGLDEFEGAKRNVSTHAAGVVISPRGHSIDEYIPVMTDKKTDKIITAVDMGDVESHGLLKMDFLGLENLDIINDTLKAINGKEGNYYQFLDKILNKQKLEDQKIIDDIFAKQDTVGIFQMEETGMRQQMAILEIDRFYDIVILTSAARPGPKDFIPYMADCKKGIRKPEYDDPRLEPVLKDTWGVILFQEQAIELFRVMAGFDLAQADIARRAIGKKKEKLMDELKVKFIDGSTKNGYSPSTASVVFDKIAKHSGYSFNKSHAYAYSVTTWMTAYLKCYYRKAFLASVLSRKSTASTRKYIDDLKKQDIKVLPPDVGASSYGFKLENLDTGKYKNHSYYDRVYKDFEGNEEEFIRFGTGTIKSVPEDYDTSENGPYESFVDFVRKNPSLNLGAIRNLAKAGAFDSFGVDRDVVLYNVEEEDLLKSIKSTKTHPGQKSLLSTIKKKNKTSDLKQPKERWNKKDLFINEVEVSSYCFTISFREAFEKEIKDYTSGYVIKDFVSKPGEMDNIKFIGIVYAVKVHRNKKKGTLTIFLSVGDFESQIELILFDRAIEASANRMNEKVSDKMFKENDIVLVDAMKSVDKNGGYSFIVKSMKRLNER